MTCAQKQFTIIRSAVRNAMFDARDNYLWYLEHDPDSSMAAYYLEKLEQLSAVNVLLRNSSGIEIKNK